MTKKEFIKKLNKYLKRLPRKARKEELAKYDNLESYDLNPITEANKIYNAYGYNYQIKNIKFLEAANILLNELKGKNTLKIILFTIYILIIAIFIKIPFIYVRDIIANIFSTTLNEIETIYIIWNLSIELLYAITAIFTLVYMIKTKALTYKKDE